MSRLTDTKRAYEQIATLLDQEILKKKGNTKDLERFRESLDVAFYLLAFSQFEHLVKREAKEVIEQHAAVRNMDSRAWQYMLGNLKAVPLRKQLDVIFHGDDKLLLSLHKDYDVRNDAAHDYKLLPKEARIISDWVQSLEDLISRF
ncbi:hypothetical protein [Variovorax sp.]|uniref:hypothetical protein n=1 Tax=Variovorax sp. TaxID=1871043 RepID=UPI003BAABC2F